MSRPNCEWYKVLLSICSGYCNSAIAPFRFIRAAVTFCAESMKASRRCSTQLRYKCELSFSVFHRLFPLIIALLYVGLFRFFPCSSNRRMDPSPLLTIVLWLHAVVSISGLRRIRRSAYGNLGACGSTTGLQLNEDICSLFC